MKLIYTLSDTSATYEAWEEPARFRTILYGGYGEYKSTLYLAMPRLVYSVMKHNFCRHRSLGVAGVGGRWLLPVPLSHTAMTDTCFSGSIDIAMLSSQALVNLFWNTRFVHRWMIMDYWDKVTSDLRQRGAPAADIGENFILETAGLKPRACLPVDLYGYMGTAERQVFDEKGLRRIATDMGMRLTA